MHIHQTDDSTGPTSRAPGIARRIGALVATLVAVTAMVTATAGTAQAGGRKGGADFAGTVALSNCSGSVVVLPVSKAANPALVLTNGHCLESGMPAQGEVIVDQPSTRRFDLLDAKGAKVGTLQASKVAYSTMTDTDITLYQLTSSYAQISQQYGIAPLKLSAERPQAGTGISVVSGFWKKIYSCGIDAFAYRLHEADWIWKQSARYTPKCQTIGGTSGSPVVDDATGEVVAVNNTFNEQGEKCTLNNPCEVDKNGKITIHKGIGYAQQTYLIADCVSGGSIIDLGAKDCDLPRP